MKKITQVITAAQTISQMSANNSIALTLLKLTYFIGGVRAHKVDPDLTPEIRAALESEFVFQLKKVLQSIMKL